mgnify:CR=1 FL=1
MVLFSEDHIQETRRRGRIEVICGSMFSGKTEELIRRMKRAKFAKQRVEIFKPAIDTRYSEEDVVSHDSHWIWTSKEIHLDQCHNCAPLPMKSPKFMRSV